MGRTLSFLDHLLSSAREHLTARRPRNALTVLRRLTHLTDLPLAPAAAIQEALGETLLALGDFRRARRHLRRAIQWQPTSARAHHLLAQAIIGDPRVDAALAGRAFARALELDPLDVRLLMDAGGYHLDMGRTEKGLALLAQAAKLAPGDIEVLRSLVHGLCEAERFDEALREVQVARFRLRGEPALAQLRDAVAYHSARHEQQKARAVSMKTSAPAVLPFLGLVSDRPASVRGRRYRRDVISSARPHLPRAVHHLDSGRSG